ncbi:hypothetical protein [Candidatus Chlorohelix sp.]
MLNLFKLKSQPQHYSKKGQDPLYPVVFFKVVPRLGQVIEALERWAI